MTDEQLNRGRELRIKIQVMETGTLDSSVDPSEPYYEEICRLIKQKREDYITALKREFDAL